MASLSKTKIVSYDAIQKFFSVNAEILLFIINNNEVNNFRFKIIHYSSEDFFISSVYKKDFFEKIYEGMILFFKILPPDSYFIEFSSNIISKVEKDGIIFLRIKFPEFIFKYQRRETFRINVSIPAIIRLARLASLNNIAQKEEIAVKILDLSLGGALIASDFLFKEGQKGIIYFSIDNEMLDIYFSVKRIKKMKSIKTKYLFHFGIFFTDLKEVFNQKLSQFIIKKQLESLKRF